MVIWICGPSAAGKTTIGRALYRQLKPDMPTLFLLDGDDFRAATGDDLQFTLEDRRKNGHRIARFCKLLEAQDINVICCAATIHPEVQEFNRVTFHEYCEVLIEVSFETLLRRDTKQIYKSALEGKLSDVIGVDIKFLRPAGPHLVLNNDEDRTSFDDFVHAIMAHINNVTTKLRPGVVLDHNQKIARGLRKKLVS